MTRVAAVLVVAATLVGGGAESYAARTGDLVTGDLYVISSAGGARHALTDTPGVYENQLSLSPDGQTIAYLGYPGIELINRDGSARRPLGTASGERPQWSPDGRSLAYSRSNSSLCFPPAQNCVFTDVWTVKADGTEDRKLLDVAVHPVWSPGGGRLAFRDFVWGEGGDVVDELNVVRPDGSGLLTLATGQAIDGVHSVPAWSPNGKWIAFNRYDGSDHLLLVRSNGSHRHRLTYGLNPAWSPNGKQIAFEREGRGYHGVWVISSAGGRARRLTLHGSCPTWSPGGKSIAYLTNTDETEGQLVIVRPNGRGRRVLATAATCDAFGWAEPSPPAWSRDGRSIYFVG